MIEGEFKERSIGKTFYYKSTANPWALANGCRYELHFPNTGEIRFCDVLKTVCYVAVDEDANGRAVFDKWFIVRKWEREVEQQNVEQ